MYLILLAVMFCMDFVANKKHSKCALVQKNLIDLLIQSLTLFL